MKLAKMTPQAKIDGSRGAGDTRRKAGGGESRASRKGDIMHLHQGATHGSRKNSRAEVKDEILSVV